MTCRQDADVPRIRCITNQGRPRPSGGISPWATSKGEVDLWISPEGADEYGLHHCHSRRVRKYSWINTNSNLHGIEQCRKEPRVD